jgi:hypothetical protein
MNDYAIHTFGEPIKIQAHHFVVNKETGQIDFYKSETEKDEAWIVFLHGVSAINSRGPHVNREVKML